MRFVLALAAVALAAIAATATPYSTGTETATTCYTVADLVCLGIANSKKCGPFGVYLWTCQNNAVASNVLCPNGCQANHFVQTCN